MHIQSKFIDVYFGWRQKLVKHWIMRGNRESPLDNKFKSIFVTKLRMCVFTEQSPVFNVEVWKNELLYFVYISRCAFQVVHMVKINLMWKKRFFIVFSWRLLDISVKIWVLPMYSPALSSTPMNTHDFTFLPTPITQFQEPLEHFASRFKMFWQS